MSRGATARLFVAVELPLLAREELAEWARGVVAGSRAAGSSRAALRPLGVQSLHLTLCFLGSRPVAELDALAGALVELDEHACELAVGAPLWLPARRPRALAVEVRDRGGELAGVHARVNGALTRVSSWQPERRRLRPHVTLVRVGRGSSIPLRSRSERSNAQRPLPATPRLSFMAEAIVLYRSWLAPDGASYEALARSELAPAPG